MEPSKERSRMQYTANRHSFTLPNYALCTLLYSYFASIERLLIKSCSGCASTTSLLVAMACWRPKEWTIISSQNFLNGIVTYLIPFFLRISPFQWLNSMTAERWFIDFPLKLYRKHTNFWKASCHIFGADIRQCFPKDSSFKDTLRSLRNRRRLYSIIRHWTEICTGEAIMFDMQLDFAC